MPVRAKEGFPRPEAWRGSPRPGAEWDSLASLHPMSLTAWIYALGSAPLFAARPFLAAFLTALVARFGTSFPFVGDSDAVRALSAAPEWFTNSTCLLVLGVLAAG